MKYPDSANFLNSIAKRARKYYLGVTTITQDAEDFLSIDLGKAIIQNSSMQMLLKQSAAAIDRIGDVFYLSEGEKHLLLAADVGEGLFFAGPAHAAMRIIASPEEHAIATTKPQERQKPATQERVAPSPAPTQITEPTKEAPTNIGKPSVHWTTEVVDPQPPMGNMPRPIAFPKPQPITIPSQKSTPPQPPNVTPPPKTEQNWLHSVYDSVQKNQNKDRPLFTVESIQTPTQNTPSLNKKV